MIILFSLLIKILLELPGVGCSSVQAGDGACMLHSFTQCRPCISNSCTCHSNNSMGREELSDLASVVSASLTAEVGIGPKIG